MLIHVYLLAILLCLRLQVLSISDRNWLCNVSVCICDNLMLDVKCYI